MIKQIDQDIAQNLQVHLKLLKTSTDINKDEQFYTLMVKAKELFGQTDRRMAPFYRQYGLYTLDKIRTSTQIFGENAQKAMKQMNQQDQAEEIVEEEQKQEDSKSQNEESKDNQPQKDVRDPNQPQITSDRENGKEGEEKVNENVENENEQEDDDEEVCYLNLQVAKNILTQHLAKHKQSVVYSEEELQKLKYQLCEVKIDLGDFFIFKQDNEKAITEYQQALEIRSEIPEVQRDRMYAELHYLIGLAYLGQKNRQEKAFTYMLKAVEVLINHLEFISQIKIQQRPTQKKPNVNRLEYLPTMKDSPQVKDLKETLLPLLDKLQDLELEILQMDEFEKAREEDRKRTQVNQNPFGAPTIPTTTPIISLGTLGNTSTATGSTNPLIRIKPKATVVPTNSTITPSTSAPPKTQVQNKPINTNVDNETQTDYQKQRTNTDKSPQNNGTI